MTDQLKQTVLKDSLVVINKITIPEETNVEKHQYVFKVDQFDVESVKMMISQNKSLIEYIYALQKESKIDGELIDIIFDSIEKLKSTFDSDSNQYISIGWENDIFIYIIKSNVQHINKVSGTHFVAKLYYDKIDALTTYTEYVMYGFGTLVAVSVVGLCMFLYSKLDDNEVA